MASGSALVVLRACLVLTFFTQGPAEERLDDSLAANVQRGGALVEIAEHAKHPYCSEITTLLGVWMPPTMACNGTSPVPSPAGTDRLI